MMRMVSAAMVSTIVLFFLIGCGEEKASPVEVLPETLNTTVHNEGGGHWDNGIATLSREWKLLSVSSAGTRGSYNIVWTNGTEEDVTVRYNLRFYDSSNFELDRWNAANLVTLVAGETGRLTTGTFVLDDIAGASPASVVNLHLGSN